jgi:hypothetical protein
MRQSRLQRITLTTTQIQVVGAAAARVGVVFYQANQEYLVGDVNLAPAGIGPGIAMELGSPALEFFREWHGDVVTKPFFARLTAGGPLDIYFMEIMEDE